MCNQPQYQILKQKFKNLDVVMVIEILGSIFMIIYCTNFCVLSLIHL